MIQIYFCKNQYDILSKGLNQCRSVPAYMAPGGEVAPPNQNRDTPSLRLRSSTFHFRDTPQEPKMLRALKKLTMGRFARYNRFPSRRHLKNHSIQEIEFIFTFLGQKSQKVDLKAPFSFFKNWIIFNDLLAGATEHKSENIFFCLQIFENFWNFFLN